jgi:hypothetical protein
MVLGVLAAGLAGCSIAPYASETTALNTAAAQFKAAVSGDAPVTTARTSAGKARLIEFLAEGSIPPFADCSTETTAAANFDADVAAGKPAEVVDQSYHALVQTPACGWTLALEPNPPAAAAAPPIVKALNDYYAGVAAIAAASSVQQVVDATTKATAAASALAALAPFPGGGTAAKIAAVAIDDLVKYGLQAAQYHALERVLGDVDPLLDPAQGPIVAALRVQQGYWISQVSFFAGDGASALHKAFDTARDAQVRFTLYQAAEPILDDLAADQQAVRTDPATAVHALIAAHHKLYATLRAHKGQLSSVLAAAQDMAGSAKTLTGSPAGGHGGKATAKPGATEG